MSRIVAGIPIKPTRTRNPTGPRTVWHAPRPGPSYWDWRCLRCGEPVRLHAHWWRRMFHGSSDPS